MRKRVMVALVIGLGLVGLLAACGKSDGGHDMGSMGDASGGDFNTADVTFVQGMIPHHQQAVEMASMADAQASSTAVKDLASRIRNAQGPEIKEMKGWLKDWGQSEMSSSMNMDMGMMSDADMKNLEAAKGAKFDRMFLTMMTTHHQGAIEMAQTELKSGKNPDAKKLARSIIKAQQGEIDEMATLLKDV